jgi:hypothetical protein
LCFRFIAPLGLKQYPRNYHVRVDGQELVIGGTSAVAPLWAGLIALMNQKLGHPVGFLAFADLREKCRVRTASLYERLAVLTTAGRIVKSNQGYRLTDR